MSVAAVMSVSRMSVAAVMRRGECSGGDERGKGDERVKDECSGGGEAWGA
jgi:hypothetical protein